MSKRAFYFGLFVVAVLIFSLYRAKYGARDSAQAIAQVEAEIALEEARRLELLAELSHRSRQEWLEEYARHSLGMGPPRADQYVSLEGLKARIDNANEEGAGAD